MREFCVAVRLAVIVFFLNGCSLSVDKPVDINSGTDRAKISQAIAYWYTQCWNTETCTTPIPWPMAVLDVYGERDQLLRAGLLSVGTGKDYTGTTMRVIVPSDTADVFAKNSAQRVLYDTSIIPDSLEALTARVDANILRVDPYDKDGRIEVRFQPIIHVTPYGAVIHPRLDTHVQTWHLRPIAYGTGWDRDDRTSEEITSDNIKSGLGNGLGLLAMLMFAGFVYLMDCLFSWLFRHGRKALSGGAYNERISFWAPIGFGALQFGLSRLGQRNKMGGRQGPHLGQQLHEPGPGVMPHTSQREP